MFKRVLRPKDLQTAKLVDLKVYYTGKTSLHSCVQISRAKNEKARFVLPFHSKEQPNNLS